MTALISLSATPDGSVQDASLQNSGVAVLEILHGLHQGVALILDKPVYVIGSAASADLVLGDADIAAQHARLRFSDDRVAIEAMGNDVTVVDALGQHLVISKGHGQRLGLPVELKLGQSHVRLRSTRPAKAASAVPGALRAFRLPMLGALLLLVTCATAFAFRAPPEAVHNAAANTPPMAVQVAAPTLAEARSWLDQALRDARLGQLRIEEHDGQLSVAGSYPAALKNSWLQVQRAFDSRFGQRVVLTPNVQVNAAVATPRVRLQAVWFGRNPYVIDEHGKRVYPGALLADDWTLESIEGDQVHLVRGQERFAFTL
ncbi:FHA domain-containing protein [Pseudomonas syringae]|uniref:SctD/MshK family protein n=1 Tax=Pseudomonas syringae TaxID=317 RepID=UPI0003FCA57B|nr:FHA domain-containing protein [Pseudomonas syringae]